MSAGTLLLTLSLAVSPLQWSPEPTGVTDGVLYRIEGTTPHSLWTVGIDITRDGEALAFSPLALHRERGRWVETKQPVTSGRLDDVAVRRPSDVWAVGTAPDDVDGLPYVQHWNGRKWAVVKSPALQPGWGGSFTSVSTAPNGDLWITGNSFALDGSAFEQLLYRYANGTWHRIPTEGVPSYLWNTIPLSPRDVWAVGIGGIAHFDGQTWTPAKLPGDTGPRELNLQDLVVRGPKDVWAVGHRPDDTLWRRPLIVHYDGTTWTELATPAETGQLHSLQFVDGKPIALGENPESGREPYLLVRKGDAFVRADSPEGAGALYDSVLVRGRIWAVGTNGPDGDDVADPYVATSKW
ncbi:beta propeller repeat protein [Tenggerimyces flavus]|uniref:Uncharacterized protein n=1 Tax=Tenggerimyces flavus TaxID=1708749 RepID=A0ABV7YM19_9ACTN|nr:hypothetical protein [Tenggerimyces flavus]MBM7784950.1 hypothetical protein [Tenggerimyces flavus]